MAALKMKYCRHSKAWVRRVRGIPVIGLLNREDEAFVQIVPSRSKAEVLPVVHGGVNGGGANAVAQPNP